MRVSDGDGVTKSFPFSPRGQEERRQTCGNVFVLISLSLHPPLQYISFSKYTLDQYLNGPKYVWRDGVTAGSLMRFSALQ